MLGDWLQARGNRANLVIAAKGAHPLIESLDVPRASAFEVRADLEGSLAKLHTDVVDLYWLHRDDPARPVEHFIDLLNAFVREGKIRFFGASNWSTERLRAANDHARRSGQHGFSANQPFWRLGVQQSRPPPFTGYVKLDAGMYRWHLETGLALVPYTSQASGFFSKLARGDAGLESHEFHVPANLAAGRIVAELAAAKRVAPSAIVLAYLWSRPLPVVPIIGCRSLAQLEDSVAALPLRLAADEWRALDAASQSGL